MKFCAQPAGIWSAVTCQRFCRFGDLSPKQGRVQRPGRVGRLPAFDGDKSPAESADKSAHSKAVAASPRWVHLCPSVVSLPDLPFIPLPPFPCQPSLAAGKRLPDSAWELGQGNYQQLSSNNRPHGGSVSQKGLVALVKKFTN